MRRLSRSGLIVAILLVVFVLDRTGLLERVPKGGPEPQRPTTNDLTDDQRLERNARDMATYDGKTFRVSYVVDGDTLDIAHRDGLRKTTRIRLWGVDTPETVKPETPVQRYGPEASDFTKKATLGKTVTLQLAPGRDTRGNHGRLLAYVVLPDGTTLNRQLIATGHGYADPRYDHPHKAEYLGLMDDARLARRGLWARATQDDLPYYLQRD